MGVRIGVVGAGIGGLAAAALLVDAGHEVTLIERFDTPQPLGSGLVVQPVGLAVLDALGVGDAARDLGAPIAQMLGHAGRRVVLDVRYRRDAPGLAMHRASLFAVLWQAAQARGVAMETGHAARGVEGGFVLRDGAAAVGPFDLVVDASGAGSRLSPLVAHPLPFGAVWASVPWVQGSELPGNQLTQRYFRASRMAGVLPIGRLPGDAVTRAAVFWSLPMADLDRWPQIDFPAWKSDVGRFWPAMAPFLAGLMVAGDMTPARYGHGSLVRPWARGDRLYRRCGAPGQPAARTGREHGPFGCDGAGAGAGGGFGRRVATVWSDAALAPGVLPEILGRFDADVPIAKPQPAGAARFCAGAAGTGAAGATGVDGAGFR